MDITLTDADADGMTAWRIQRASMVAHVEAFTIAEAFGEDEPIPYALTPKAEAYLARLNGKRDA
jgi:hypothetical protein